MLSRLSSLPLSQTMGLLLHKLLSTAQMILQQINLPIRSLYILPENAKNAYTFIPRQSCMHLCRRKDISIWWRWTKFHLSVALSTSWDGGPNQGWERPFQQLCIASLGQVWTLIQIISIYMLFHYEQSMKPNFTILFCDPKWSSQPSSLKSSLKDWGALNWPWPLTIQL